MMPWRWIATLLVFVSHGALFAQSPLEEFFTQHCVKCHGPKTQMGKVRLDRSTDAIFSDTELLETVVAVLEAGEMPPETAPQPQAKARADAIEMLQHGVLTNRPVTVLKRLTRSEYTNTLTDLFGLEFDFTGLLPPDHVERGFDKFGEAHLMSPHQVMAYLKTARFVAERLLPNAKPVTSDWKFDARHFHGSGNVAVGGGGDYLEGDGFLS